MKIIELNFYLGGGGASRLMADLSNQYASNKNNEVITVSVIESESAGNDFISFKKDLIPSVKYIALNKKSGLGWASLYSVFRLIKKEHPDVVHLHANILLLLLPVLFCQKVNYVHTIHTLVTRQYPNGIIKRIANWLYRKGKVIPVTISQECHESYKECFGRQEDILITNGREALKTTEKLLSVKKELSDIGVRQGTPVFLHVARHHPVKNHDRMFKTFQRLSNEGIDYQLIVIGDHYDVYEKQFNGHKQIHLIGARTNIGDYMSFADFFVLTSDKEGLPLSLLEAMSMGVIPVCTPAGGIKDVLRNGENGFMAKEVSDESFYQVVKQALYEGSKISRNSIIKEYKEKYSMEVCAKHYMDIYKKYK
jgi:glycosyltransferase involved in cell wall biosynthesis